MSPSVEFSQSLSDMPARRAAASARSRLTVSSGRVYSVAVTREQSGDRDTLVLLEPAMDGR